MIQRSYMIDHASDGQSLKCSRIRQIYLSGHRSTQLGRIVERVNLEQVRKFSRFTSLDSEVRTGALLALRVLCESHLLSEVHFRNYCQPAM